MTCPFGILDEGDGAGVVHELGSQLLQLRGDGREDVDAARTNAVGRQDDACSQTRQLLVGGRLLELRAEVVDGGVHELRVGVGLAFHPFGIPVVLVEAGRLLFLDRFPVLVNRGGIARIQLQLRAVGKHEAARTGRVASHHLLLFGEHDLLARKRRSHGRSQTGIARADDEDVRLLVEADRLVAHNGSFARSFRRCRLAGFAAVRAATRQRRSRTRNEASRAAHFQKIPPRKCHRSSFFLDPVAGRLRRLRSAWRSSAHGAQALPADAPCSVSGCGELASPNNWGK